MAYSFTVERTNNSFLTVYADEPCIHEEIYEFFKVRDPSFKPSRFSKYDGTVRMYDKLSGRLPVGLLPHLLKNFKRYEFTLDPRLKNIRDVTREEIIAWCDSVELPFILKDYQYEAVYHAIKYRRSVMLADTGAGKSVIMYLIVKFLLEMGVEGRFLILAPSILLVEQILGDFISYGWSDAPKFCQQILGGRTHMLSKKVVISTWQSLKDEDTDYFQDFEVVLCDEVHGASAKEQKKVIERCRNAPDKIGFTGTLKGTELHQMQVEGLFGLCKQIATTQDLKDRGQASETCVIGLNVQYTELDKVRVEKLDYEGQVQYVMQHKGRQQAIANLAIRLSKVGENSLVLFDRVEDGIFEFKKLIVNVGYGDRVRIIESSVKLNERLEIKDEMETTTEGLILLATWGTMSTGVSIKKLHNLIFNSSGKSIIRILQSLGRVLRIHESKEIAKIFDVVDDFRRTSSSRCIFIEHVKERLGFYKGKKHQVKFKKVDLAGEGPSTEEFEAILRDSDKRKQAKRKREGLQLLKSEM